MKNGLTIGIPVYNEDPYIERAILCASPQCEKLIVADNASTDRTSQICEKLLAELPNMEYFRHAENIGALSNWKSIIDKVDTPYVMILGSHDYIDDDYAQKLLDELKADESIVAAFGQLIFEYETRTEDARALNKWQGGMHQDPVNRVRNLLFDRVHAVWAIYGLFKTKFFKMCFTKDLPPYGADAIFLAKILALGRLTLVKGTHYHAWMRDIKKTPSDYLERITAKKRGGADKWRMRNEFRIAQFEAIMRLLPSANIWRISYLRLLGMVRFGLFKKPGFDPLFFLLYIPTKMLRWIGRVIRFSHQET